MMWNSIKRISRLRICLSQLIYSKLKVEKTVELGVKVQILPLQLKSRMICAQNNCINIQEVTKTPFYFPVTLYNCERGKSSTVHQKIKMKKIEQKLVSVFLLLQRDDSSFTFTGDINKFFFTPKKYSSYQCLHLFGPPTSSPCPRSLSSKFSHISATYSFNGL